MKSGGTFIPQQSKITEESEINKDSQYEAVDWKATRKQHQQQLEERVKIQRRIEAMRRQFDFISKLDTADVGYILEKQKEHAAIVIQRLFRAFRIRKQIKERKAGLYAKLDEEDQLNLPEDTGRVKKHKAEYEILLREAESSIIDNYYRQIGADRARELIEEVDKRRKIVSETDMKKYDLDQIKQGFERKFDHFNENFAINEQGRQQAFEQLKHIAVMKHYLIDHSELIKKRRALAFHNHAIDQYLDPHAPREPLVPEEEEVNLEYPMHSAAAERLQQIKMYSKIADNVGQEDLKEVRRKHLDKLADYRKRKDWQGWIEEDDLDMEGERLLAEIKNYKGEQMFHGRFY